MGSENLVVIGNGCGGTEVAFAARSSGWSGSITLIGDEGHAPYHRPPLSKAYLKHAATGDDLALRNSAAYERDNIVRRDGCRIARIDRRRSVVIDTDGEEFAYDRLVLAVGGRPRKLTAAEELPIRPGNLHYLRTRDDATTLRDQITPGRRLVIVGAGYVGLEVAAAASSAGMQVTVLEAAERVLARVAGPTVSAFYVRRHQSAGVDIQTGCLVKELETSPESGSITAVSTTNGDRIPADLVLAGIGLIPNCELAQEAGLAVENGILVDRSLQTSDDRILAIGDCARWYSDLYDRYVRIESVPNALAQARNAAAALCDQPLQPVAVPWFWSDQYDLSLKMAGLSEGYERIVVRGDQADAKFTAFYLDGDRVIAADTVNSPADFTAAKRLITQNTPVTDDLLASTDAPLRDLLAQSGLAGTTPTV